VNATSKHPRPTSNAKTLRRLDEDISKSRDELGVFVAELDRRRHWVFDLRAQLKRHIVEISLAGAALTAMSIAAIWLSVRRARRRASLILKSGIEHLLESRPHDASRPTQPFERRRRNAQRPSEASRQQQGGR
jgi:hypothetical protein